MSQSVGCPTRAPFPLTAVLLAGGILNALVYQVVDAWHGGGFNAIISMFGIAPLVLVIAAIAFANHRVDNGRNPGAADILCMALLLVPSSLFAWAVTGLYAGWCGLRAPAGKRAGSWLICGLAACALWQALGIRILGAWLLLPDTMLVEQILRLMRDGIVRHGNVVGVPGVYQIVMLAGCSTLQPLPLVLLGSMATALLHRQHSQTAALAGRAMLAGLGFIALNLVRLVLLAWSEPVYTFVHGTIGQNLFDGTVILLLMLQPMRVGRA